MGFVPPDLEEATTQFMQGLPRGFVPPDLEEATTQFLQGLPQGFFLLGLEEARAFLKIQVVFTIV